MQHMAFQTLHVWCLLKFLSRRHYCGMLSQLLSVSQRWIWVRDGEVLGESTRVIGVEPWYCYPKFHYIKWRQFSFTVLCFKDHNWGVYTCVSKSCLRSPVMLHLCYSSRWGWFTYLVISKIIGELMIRHKGAQGMSWCLKD